MKVVFVITYNDPTPGWDWRRRPCRRRLVPQHDREEARRERRAQVRASRPAAGHVRHLRRQHRQGRQRHGQALGLTAS